ncbi:MAG: hypothetical protein HZA11_00645 [Nitrospirae bacterium]|nr:hypothetical protein [Nitrospirota bacterium]
MKISSGSLFILLLVVSVGLFSGSAFGEDKKEAPVYTNQDIEKYKRPSDSKTGVVKTDNAERKKEKSQKSKEEHEKEYWCKTASSYKKKIEKVKDDIAEAEKELSGESSMNVSYKKKKTIQNKITKSKKQLRYAEKDLGGLEDEAHRKEVPPGWLRCQFE